MGRPALLSMEANGSCGSNLSFREGLESGRRQRAIAGRRVYENEEPGFGRAFRWVSHRVENARRDLGSSTVFPGETARTSGLYARKRERPRPDDHPAAASARGRARSEMVGLFAFVP
jgi:hypothetical protein